MRQKNPTSKKRKLEYIREKNYYRLGGTGSNYVKIAQELIDDVSFVHWLVNEQIPGLERKYKMYFETISFEIGFVNDDFIKNLKTILFKFKRI